MEFDQTLHTINVGNSHCTVSQFGGQLLSWSIDDTEVLFENKSHAVRDLVTAYRGGAPICFPYFGKGLLLSSERTIQPEITPQHGKSRTALWKLLDHSHSSITVETIQPYPGKDSGDDLRLTVQYALADQKNTQALEINAVVENIGTQSTLYQLAFHTYWNCTDPSAAQIDGLESEYLDNLDTLSLKTENPFKNIYPNATDRVYLSPERTVTIDTPMYKAVIESEDLSQAVVWNPGASHTLKDVQAPEFFCVESGIINPSPLLDPHQRRIFKLHYAIEIKKP